MQREAARFAPLTTQYYAVKLEVVVRLTILLLEFNHEGSASTEYLATPEWGVISAYFHIQSENSPEVRRRSTGGEHQQIHKGDDGRRHDGGFLGGA